MSQLGQTKINACLLRPGIQSYLDDPKSFFLAIALPFLIVCGSAGVAGETSPATKVFFQGILQIPTKFMTTADGPGSPESTFGLRGVIQSCLVFANDDG